MIVFGLRDNSLCDRLLRECNLTLSRAICVDHAAEKTCKNASEILKSQPTADIDNTFKKKPNKSSHNTQIL